MALPYESWRFGVDNKPTVGSAAQAMRTDWGLVGWPIALGFILCALACVTFFTSEPIQGFCLYQPTFCERFPSSLVFAKVVFVSLVIVSLGAVFLNFIHSLYTIASRGPESWTPAELIGVVTFALLGIFSIVIAFSGYYTIFGLRNTVASVDVTDPWSGLFFSSVTWATVGYGDLIPIAIGARIAAMTEMFVGISITALFTATVVVLFSRISVAAELDDTLPENVAQALAGINSKLASIEELLGRKPEH